VRPRRACQAERRAGSEQEDRPRVQTFDGHRQPTRDHDKHADEDQPAESNSTRRQPPNHQKGHDSSGQDQSVADRNFPHVFKAERPGTGELLDVGPERHFAQTDDGGEPERVPSA
jgi:hypothetical protein